jgi:transcriptional regulator with XRE-family HTH domain
MKEGKALSFAKNLKSVMQEQNLSQTDLSNLTGIGSSSLSQYLLGQHIPYKRRIAQLANALGVSVARLTATGPGAEEAPPIISHQKISVAETARRLGKSQQFIRVSLQRGIAPFGFATKVSGNAYDYHISPKLLDDYIGGKLTFQPVCACQNSGEISGI